MPSNRVLLVEDDNDTREVTALLLGHAGYEVIVATDIASGVAIARGQPGIDVILSDMYLSGGQTGTALIQSIRDSGLDIPIVLTSADDGTAIPARDLNVMFLPKPYGLRALLSAMHVANGSTSQAQQLR